VDLDGIKVRVAAIEDLIRMKQAAGRPKDVMELEVLGALRDELDNK
jgi:predicted nucleotidyltransferase